MARTSAHPTTSPASGPVPGTDWWRLVLVGIVAGFTSGLFGVGGGIVMVPALALVAGLHHKLATGTSLTAIVPISIAGAAGYATAGEIDWRVAGLVALGAVVGAVAGTRYLRTVSAPVLQLVFAGFMVVTAVRLVVGDDVDGAGMGTLSVGVVIGLIVLGLAAGLLAGLLGVGGGIIIVPALTILFGAPLVLAKGTSLAVIVPTAIMGTMRNRSAGLTAVRAGVAVGLAGVVSALVAARISLDLDPTLSAALFAVLLVVVAVRLGRASVGELRESGPTTPRTGTLPSMSPFRRRRRPPDGEGTPDTDAAAAAGGETDPIHCWQASVVGHRAENQDRCAASSRWAVVSDGMGGHAGGARAAELTRDAAVAAIGEDPDGDLVAVLTEAVRRANHAVRTGQQTDPSVAGMGATLVAAVAAEVAAERSAWVVANIGDSPAWLVTGDGARQVTTDHTLAAALEAARAEGVDDPIPARAHHLLMRAIGLDDDDPPDVHEVELAPGDTLVLASDGVSDVFDADAVAAAVRSAGPDDDPARSLVDRALEAGTADNVTVVVLRHDATDATA